MKKTIITSVVAIALAIHLNAQTDTMAINTSSSEMNGTQDDINETGVVGISNWSSFNELSIQMYTLKGANYFTTIGVIKSLEPTMNSLMDTKPMWMNTEEINEDIRDLQDEYQELMSDMDADDEEFRENLEEISEKYEDLREEALEVFREYKETVKDGNEEFKEEIEKSRSKTKNMKDGSEEYREETKELKNIPDGKKN